MRNVRAIHPSSSQQSVLSFPFVEITMQKNATPKTCAPQPSLLHSVLEESQQSQHLQLVLQPTAATHAQQRPFGHVHHLSDDATMA